MLLFGLLLVAATGAFTALLIADNLSGGPEYQVTVLGNDLVTLDSLEIFLAGLALALLFCLGLGLTLRSLRRARTARAVRAAGPTRKGRRDRADEPYRDDRPSDAHYPHERDPDERHPDEQYRDERYPDERYADARSDERIMERRVADDRISDEPAARTPVPDGPVAGDASPAGTPREASPRSRAHQEPDR